MAHLHDQQVPRGALIAAAALMLVAIAAAGLTRQGLIARTDPVAPAQIVLSRDLVFVDRRDGGIAVLAAGSGETLELIAPGSDGFVRGVLRGLVRERRQHGFGSEKPFRLLRQSDGRLTLVDLATQRRIELVSFGPTNVKAFARFLPSGEKSS